MSHTVNLLKNYSSFAHLETILVSSFFNVPWQVSFAQGLTFNKNLRIDSCSDSCYIQIWESISLIELYSKCYSFSEIWFSWTDTKVSPGFCIYTCIFYAYLSCQCALIVCKCKGGCNKLLRTLLPYKRQMDCRACHSRRVRLRCPPTVQLTCNPLFQLLNDH